MRSVQCRQQGRHFCTDLFWVRCVFPFTLSAPHGPNFDFHSGALLPLEERGRKKEPSKKVVRRKFKGKS